MKPNHVKRKLQTGGMSIGTFAFEFNTSGIGRLAAGAGADFIVYDMEHSGWSLETIRLLVATTPAERCVPMVRVPATQYHFVARALDVGAMGVMAPMVESAEQAATLAAAAKYPPVGRRGAAFAIAHDDYQGGDIVDKMRSADAEGLLIAQIETEAGVRNVEAIAATEGIDVLWIGHFDLSISLGIPGEFNAPRFQEAVARVLQACDKHGKIPAMMTADISTGQALLHQGFRMLAFGGDLWLYQTALRQGIAELAQGRIGRT
ncbi:MAG TPA: aldolase/citrate lyase family protein [Pirellulales bacterium]